METETEECKADLEASEAQLEELGKCQSELFDTKLLLIEMQDEATDCKQKHEQAKEQLRQDWECSKSHKDSIISTCSRTERYSETAKRLERENKALETDLAEQGKALDQCIAAQSIDKAEAETQTKTLKTVQSELEKARSDLAQCTQQAEKVQAECSVDRILLKPTQKALATCKSEASAQSEKLKQSLADCLQETELSFAGVQTIGQELVKCLSEAQQLRGGNLWTREGLTDALQTAGEERIQAANRLPERETATASLTEAVARLKQVVDESNAQSAEQLATLREQVAAFDKQLKDHAKKTREQVEQMKERMREALKTAEEERTQAENQAAALRVQRGMAKESERETETAKLRQAFEQSQAKTASNLASLQDQIVDVAKQMKAHREEAQRASPAQAGCVSQRWKSCKQNNEPTGRAAFTTGGSGKASESARRDTEGARRVFVVETVEFETQHERQLLAVAALA